MKNNTNTFVHFDDALKIHAICSDLEMHDSEARLLTYIHVKSIESGLGTCYFNNPSQHDTEALEIMLGNYKGSYLPDIRENSSLNNNLAAFTSDLSDKIRQLDNVLTHNFGMESRLCGELRARLRLYNDNTFRQKMTALYNDHIAPKLAAYTSDMIASAFTRHRERALRIDQEIKEATGFENM